MTPILLNSYLDKHILVYPMRTDSLTYVHGPSVPYAYYVQNPVFHSSLFNVSLMIDILLNVGDMCDLNTGDGN